MKNVKTRKQNRIAFYMRISDGESKDAEKIQEELMRKHCKVKGYDTQNAKVYIDRCPLSAFLDKRPALKTLLSDAQAKKFDTLIVHGIKRLPYTSLPELHSIIHELMSCGVKVEFIFQPIDLRTKNGQLQFNTIVALNLHERRLLQKLRYAKQSN